MTDTREMIETVAKWLGMKTQFRQLTKIDVESGAESLGPTIECLILPDSGIPIMGGEENVRNYFLVSGCEKAIVDKLRTLSMRAASTHARSGYLAIYAPNPNPGHRCGINICSKNIAGCVNKERAVDNMQFLAASWQDVADLLAEVERLRAENAAFARLERYLSRPNHRAVNIYKNNNDTLVVECTRPDLSVFCAEGPKSDFAAAINAALDAAGAER